MCVCVLHNRRFLLVKIYYNSGPHLSVKVIAIGNMFFVCIHTYIALWMIGNAAVYRR